MTVAEMIKILQTMPQDAIVEKLDYRWFSDFSEEEVEIKYNDFENTVILS